MLAPSPHAVRGGSKRTAVLHRRALVDQLDATERTRLGPALYDIFCESYGALDYDTVCDEIVFRRGGRLVTFVDTEGELVGFLTFHLDRFTFEGRPHGVFTAGTYFRRDVRGGGLHMIRESLRVILQDNLRYPRTRLSAVIECLTPVSYRRAARSFPRMWPHRDRVTPPEVQRLLQHALHRRGFRLDAERPNIVRYPDPATHTESDHLTRSATLSGDPDIAHYLQLNPSFEHGDILCVLLSVDLRDIASIAWRWARERTAPSVPHRGAAS